MAIDNPTIFCGDDTADLEMHFVELCNIRLSDYFEDERVLTRDKFQTHFNDILDLVENWSIDFPKYNNIAYQVLGAFILRLGTNLPDDLRERIVLSTRWEVDKKIKWPSNWIILRKFYLNDLKQKIQNHKYGQITHLIDLGLTEDRELNGVCIGLDQFEMFTLNQHISSTYHLNLDSCRLRMIPDSIYDLSNLKILSLNANLISRIPDGIKNLYSLEELHLKYNNIEKLPNSMKTLRELRVIDLSYNKLKLVPFFIVELGDKYFDHLNLLNNPIVEIPPAFKRFIKADFSFMIEDEENTKRNF